MRKVQGLFKVLVLISCFSGFAFAQTTETDKSAQVSSSKVLSAKTNAEEMADALKSIPGVYIISGSINIRDASSNKVLVLIDGQRMNNAQSGDFDMTTIPIDAIERVEIIRGGNSARYGADAVGGVVNLITKKATEQSRMDLGVRATYGSFNSQYYNLYTSNAISSFNYYLAYKRTQSDGDFKYKGMDGVEYTRTNNSSKANDFIGNFGYENLVPNSNLTLSAQVTQSQNGVPGSVPGVANWAISTPRAALKQDNDMFNLGFKQNKIFADANLNVAPYYHFFRTRYTDPDAGTNEDDKNYAYGVGINQDNPLSDLLTLSYGYDYRHDRVNSTSVGEKNRDTHGLYASAALNFKVAQFFFDNISIVPAARYDAPSDFEKVVSPKISVTFTNSGPYALVINAHVSQSYRAPTFNDLYWPFDGFDIGNPNLKPEKGINYDLGYGIKLPFLSQTQINMNYFYNNLKDQIIWAPRDSIVWTPTNVAKSITSGLETSISTKLFNRMISLELNHTYMDARDKSGGFTNNKLLIYRPYHKLDFNAGLSVSQFEVNLNYQYISRRFVTSSNSASLPDVSVWNMNVGYGMPLVGLKWSARLDFNNVFNKNYRLSDGYPMPGREVRFTLGCSLK